MLSRKERKQLLDQLLEGHKVPARSSKERKEMLDSMLDGDVRVLSNEERKKMLDDMLTPRPKGGGK